MLQSEKPSLDQKLTHGRPTITCLARGGNDVFLIINYLNVPSLGASTKTPRLQVSTHFKVRVDDRSCSGGGSRA